MSKLILVMMMKRTNPKASSRKTESGKRAEKKEKTKKAILKASLDLFSKKGFYRTTTKQVAKKAGIAEGTLFNYFKTKEDLALYFFERELMSLIRWYEDETKLQKAPLPEKLFGIIHRHLEQIGPYEDFIGTVYLRALQPKSKLSPLSLDRQEIDLRYLRFIREILADAEEEEEIPSFGDFGAYGVGIFHLAMLTHWLHDKSTGKENTLALLDRCLKVGTAILTKKGGWEW